MHRSFRSHGRRGRAGSGAVQLRERYLRHGTDPHARALLERLRQLHTGLGVPPAVVVPDSEAVMRYAALFGAA